MIRQLTQEMAQSLCAAPEIEQKMEQLVGQLETVKGKKSYGYLPESVKKTVDEVVDKLEELLVVRECYDQWCILQNEVENYCHDKPRERKKLAQEKKFRQIKNAIIQEAENIRLGVMTFEDEKVEDRDEWGGKLGGLLRVPAATGQDRRPQAAARSAGRGGGRSGVAGRVRRYPCQILPGTAVSGRRAAHPGR